MKNIVNRDDINWNVRYCNRPECSSIGKSGSCSTHKYVKFISGDVADLSCMYYIELITKFHECCAQKERRNNFSVHVLNDVNGYFH